MLKTWWLSLSSTASHSVQRVVCFELLATIMEVVGLADLAAVGERAMEEDALEAEFWIAMGESEGLKLQ